MSKARLVLTALIVDRQTPAEVAVRYGVHVNAITGELLRELTLDPTKDYQPTGAPKGPTRK